MSQTQSLRRGNRFDIIFSMDESKLSDLERNILEAKIIPFSEKYQRIIKVKEALYDSLALSSTRLEKADDEVCARAEYLKKKYPDYYNRAAYHVLMSSSLSSKINPIIEDDSPGKDSVEKFIEGLVLKYQERDEFLQTSQQATQEGKENLSLSILLAEDQDYLRELIARVLQEMGHTVEAVKNGKELVDRLLNSKLGEFGLVFSDNNMPKNDDGLNAFITIRGDERFKYLPFILCSGTLTSEVEERINSLGGVCLDKPFGMEKIPEVIAQAKEKARAV